MATFKAKTQPTVGGAFTPMIVFAIAMVIVAIAAQVWSYNNENRYEAVKFWTGGLGVLGVIAIGCAVFVIVWAARVFEDSLRAIQKDVGRITNAVAKTSDQVGRSVSVVGALEGILSNIKPQ
jgi:multisubunit Na+/H+ antiporter MnhB subunit